MGRLEPKHWVLIATFLASTATMMAGTHGWSDMTQPAFISGVLMQLATLIGAVFAGAPQNPNLNPVVNPGRRADDPIPPTTTLGSVTETTRRNLP